MKRSTKMSAKRLTCLVMVMLLACTMLLTGCKSDPLVIKDSDTCIVIKVTQESMGDKSDLVLIDYMQQLKDKGELEFTVENGMITSINGIQNPADFSSCWMLYTSDEENSNSAWGIVEYEGKEYGSAVAGAETIKIKPGQLYIWVFQSF